MSFAIAMSILRRFLLCCSASDSNLMRPSLVTPSTSSATSSPNGSRTSSSVDVGVLDHVVEERRLERRGVQVQLGEDERDLERVDDERLAALAHLPVVRSLGELVRLLEAGEVGIGVVRSDPGFDLFECRCHACPSGVDLRWSAQIALEVALRRSVGITTTEEPAPLSTNGQYGTVEPREQLVGGRRRTHARNSLELLDLLESLGVPHARAQARPSGDRARR